MPEASRTDLIRARLETELTPVELEIIDESHLHAGHSGHGGAGHFKVRLISARFNGETMLSRHRLVYAALNDLMQTEIHALSIEALAADEGI